MGFPVFNAFLRLLGVYYFGNRNCFNKIESEKHSKHINKDSIFSGAIMTLVCIASGFLAIHENGAAGMIKKEVLGLNFEVTSAMLWKTVLIGGITLECSLKLILPMYHGLITMVD